MMYSFTNDYSEGAHPRIIDALVKSNLEQTSGYGTDPYCAYASQLIKKQLECEDVDIHFLIGGTQTNLVAISSFLKPHHAVISTAIGHINTHETGAIEATGHKVLTTPCVDGKLTPLAIEETLNTHTDEHMVKPKLVYVSNSTEIGTIYTYAELEALRDCCKKHNLLFLLDGARLGSALCAKDNNLTLAHIARLVDAFYIGGTKNGALFGEALVICNEDLKEDFRYYIKQKGALLAKGRLLGLQFAELFKDGLYFELARHANRMASLLKEAFKAKGYTFLTDSPTNQLFPILPNDVIDKLSEYYSFSVWKKMSKNTTCVRFVTSWATVETNVLEFIDYLETL